MSKLALCRSALRAGAPVRLRVSGTSMLPLLRPGEQVTLRAASFDDLVPGDVVAFAHDRHVTVHRVIRRTGSGAFSSWITRGDARRTEDPPLQRGELLGVVTGFKRFGTERPIPGARSRLGWALSHTVGRSRLGSHALARLCAGIANLLRVSRPDRQKP